MDVGNQLRPENLNMLGYQPLVCSQSVTADSIRGGAVSRWVSYLIPNFPAYIFLS